MKLSVLGSGSTGNTVLMVANGTRVLVDAGLSAREITRRMTQVGEDPNSLDGILITHEHGDHAGGLRVLIKDLDCPVFMSAKTREAYVCERRNVSSEEPRRREDALRVREKLRAGVRDHEASRIAVEEARAELLFEVAHVRRDVRLHRIQSLRRPREVQLLGKRNEHL